MKLTLILCKQHLLRMTRRHWFLQGKKKIIPTRAEEHAANRGFQVVDAVEAFISPPKPQINFNLQAVSENPYLMDSTHPEYKIDPCYIYNDTNALLGGLEQAQVLTNTLVIDEPFPAADVKVPSDFHLQLQKKILVACAYDVEQQKLPKRKDPLRPAWNYRRDYGITDVRKNTLLCTYIARMCDQIQKSRDLSLIENFNVSLPFEVLTKQIQLELGAEIMLTSETRLSPGKHPDAFSGTQLPDLHPMDCTVSIEPQHFYTALDHYPVSPVSKWKHVHTAFVHYSPTQVANIYETPVTASQRDARILLKAFSFAAAEARSFQKELKSPVTVQAIQSDGQNFTFIVYQLNTLDCEDSTKRNFCWISPSTHLYTACGYINGRPILEGYNPEVLQRIVGLLAKR